MSEKKKNQLKHPKYAGKKSSAKAIALTES